MARYADEADSLANRNGWPPGFEDTLSYPHSALLWNLASGGKNCFSAERDLFDRLGEAVPHPVFSQIVHANNAFVHRVVAELQAVGITQFIDLGPGIPTDGLPPTDAKSLYGSVLSASRASKVVYVDNDLIVLAHARALRDQPGQVLIIDGDIYQPKEILDSTELNEFLDWAKPIGLICTAVLHEYPGPVDEIADIMACYVDRLPAGSYTAISHFLDTGDEHAKGVLHPSRRSSKAGPTTASSAPRTRSRPCSPASRSRTRASCNAANGETPTSTPNAR